MNFSIWTDDIIGNIYEKMLSRLKGTFEAMVHDGFEERVGQRQMATDVAETLKNGGILIEEAGVGIGKSFAYLIPLLILMDEYKCENRKFGPVILSTYSFQLQQQLLEDIRTIQEMLGADEFEISIAKGMNNYACLKRIEKRLFEDTTFLSEENRQILESLRALVSHNDADKINFEQIEANLWKRISALHPEHCLRCRYSATCLVPSQLQTYQDSDIIIINHAYLASFLKNNNPLIENAGAIVIDEAHTFEGIIRSIYEESFRMKDIYKVLDRIILNSVTPYSSFKNKEESDVYYKNIVSAFNQFFISLRFGAQNYYNSNIHSQNIDFIDCGDILFKDSKRLINVRNNLENVLKDLINKARKAKNNHFTYLELTEDITYLETCLEVVGDMSNPNSKYVYWTRVFGGFNKAKGIYEPKVDLVRTPKKLEEIITKLTDKKPTVFTSATLTSNTPQNKENSYVSFANSLGLTKPGITMAVPKKSPFNYKENSMFYYDSEMPSPKGTDESEYISSLASKVDELITITQGKSLVLFTNKSDMNRVFNILSNSSYPFNIFLQEDNNKEAIAKKFEEDVDSVLFATTWEGLDIAGKSLSNVIITRLPFPILDPITEYKASIYEPNEAFAQVYYAEMVKKFVQGVGRLIRKESDTGLVCLLDPRFSDYPTLPNVLPDGITMTSDIRDVITFADKKITPERIFVPSKSRIKTLPSGVE